jgi:hypothetical protein
LHSKDRLPRKIAELRSGINRLRWIREDGTLTNPGSNAAERTLSGSESAVIFR